MIEIKDHDFRYKMCFGDLSNRYVPVNTSVPTHSTSICTNVSQRKKKEEDEGAIVEKEKVKQ